MPTTLLTVSRVLTEGAISAADGGQPTTMPPNFDWSQLTIPAVLAIAIGAAWKWASPLLAERIKAQTAAIDAQAKATLEDSRVNSLRYEAIEETQRENRRAILALAQSFRSLRHVIFERCGRGMDPDSDDELDAAMGDLEKPKQ